MSKRIEITMRKFLITAVLSIAIGVAGHGMLRAQTVNLKTQEVELAKMAETILRSDSTDLKFELNKKFIVRMTELLKRPESYNYGFDSLKTISRLRPSDNSFRVFTWYIVDRPPGAYYGEYAHYYFGLVQRRYVDAKGKVHHLVIPLMELESIPRGIESMVTDNYNWFGALYYAPKGEEQILAYDGTYYKLETKDGGEMKEEKGETEKMVTFIAGKYRGRQLKEEKKLTYSNQKRVKRKVRYYVLTGWNGWDNKANYKVMDIMSFDPDDSSKVVFGAPIIYFEGIPKARALFKYSDYAPFSLNTGMVKTGFMNLGRKKMLVYDHLAPPQHARATEVYDLGPDGSYDALSYYKRYGGYFEWYRDVEVADKYEGKKHVKEMQKLQAHYAAQDSATFPDYSSLSSKKSQRQARRSTKKEYKRQRAEAERKLKESGVNMGEGKRE